MTHASLRGAPDLVERLRRYQSERGFSQQEIAEQAGVSQSVVSKILREGIEKIRTSTVRRIEGMLDAATNVSSYENVKAICDLLFERFDPATNAKNEAPEIVVLVGAGASLWAGRSSWRTLKDDLIDAAESCFSPQEREAFLRTLRNSLTPAVGLPAIGGNIRKALLDDPEITTVMIAGAIWEHLVAREAMVRLLRKTYLPPPELAGPVPQLWSELLAHLVKHEVIDHIISFNFDLTLDRALDNELGETAYDRITSPDSPLALEEPKPKRPRLIKFHGSIRTPASLRFSHADQETLSRRMVDLLDLTIFGSSRIARPEDLRKARSVVLISLGYSWQNRGIARWVESRIEDIDRIYIVRKSPRFPRELGHIPDTHKSKIHLIATDSFAGKAGRQRRSGDETQAGISIDQLLWAVTNRLYERAHEETGGSELPPPISRHLILAYLFGRPFKHKPFDQDRPQAVYRNLHTPRLRFRAELLLHIAKCKGMVNTQAMADDQRFQALLSDRPSGASHLSQKERLEEMREFLVQTSDPAAGDAYFCRADDLDALEEYFWRSQDDHPFGFNHLAEGYTREEDDKIYVPRLNEDEKTIELRAEFTKEDFLKEHVRRIFKADEIEVRPGCDPQTLWSFTRPIELTTQRQLFKREQDLVFSSSRPWAYLFAISEWSEWLNRYLQKCSPRHNAKVFVIEPSFVDTADQWHLRRFAVEEPLEAGGDQSFVCRVPWRQHNRHVFLAVDEDGLFLGGTYTRFFLRASQVAPVALEGSDCAELLCIFLGHLDRVRLDDSESDPGEVRRQVLAVAWSALENERNWVREGSIIETGSRARFEAVVREAAQRTASQ